MKALLLVMLSLSFNSFAQDSRLHMVCMSDAVDTGSQIKFYMANVYAFKNIGINRIDIFYTNGSYRKLVSRLDVQYSESNNTAKILDRSNGEVALTYRHKTSSTRYGSLVVKDGNFHDRIAVTCGLN